MTPGEMAELARIVAAQVMSHLDETWNRPAAVSLEEAARLLSCSPKHIGRLVKSGELRLVTIGKLRRVPMTEIHRLSTPLALEMTLQPSLRRMPRYSAAQAEAELARLRAQQPPAVPESVRLKAMLKGRPPAVPASAQLRALRKAHPYLMPTSAQPGGER